MQATVASIGFWETLSLERKSWRKLDGVNMNDRVSTKLGVAGWFRKIMRKCRRVPTDLNLRPVATTRGPGDLASAAVLPGNYYFVEAHVRINIGGVTHLGAAMQAIYDTQSKPPLIRWGMPLTPALATRTSADVLWTEDPENGLSLRKITAPGDLLGAEGLLGGKKYRFEQILQDGKNVVVYALISDENQTRVAYGFGRELFRGQEPPG